MIYTFIFKACRFKYILYHAPPTAHPYRSEVTISPSQVSTDEHAYVEVTCESRGIPTPVLTWHRVDSGYLAGTQDYGVLRFLAIRKSDEGQYRCVARNSVGTSEGLVTIYVNSEAPATQAPPLGPAVHINPDYYDGSPGDEVKLSCSANERGQISWKKEELVQLPHYIIVSNDGLLIIHSARREDSGRYTCTVTTYSGYTITSTVEVQIHTQTTLPRITPLEQNHLIVQGNDFSLPCIATGFPTPRVKWTKVRRPSPAQTTTDQITLSIPFFQSIVQLHEPFDSNTHQLGSVLSITRAQISNRGVYVCVAENDDGVQDQASTIIEVDRKYCPEHLLPLAKQLHSI